MKTLVAAALLSLAGLAQAAPDSRAAAETSDLQSSGTGLVHRPTSQPQGLASRASDVVFAAMSKLDVPYRLGGLSRETGFDCSGLVHAVYKQTLGLVLPRRAAEQASSTQTIAKEELRPGDLVFFNTLRRAYSHVGIYIGDNKFIHAPRTGAHVRVENMDRPYWRSRFNGARRVVPAGLHEEAAPSTDTVYAAAETAHSKHSANYQLTTAPAYADELALFATRLDRADTPTAAAEEAQATKTASVAITPEPTTAAPHRVTAKLEGPAAHKRQASSSRAPHKSATVRVADTRKSASQQVAKAGKAERTKAVKTAATQTKTERHAAKAQKGPAKSSTHAATASSTRRTVKTAKAGSGRAV